jgi:hypothetical protein
VLRRPIETTPFIRNWQPYAYPSWPGVEDSTEGRNATLVIADMDFPFASREKVRYEHSGSRRNGERLSNGDLPSAHGNTGEMIIGFREPGLLIVAVVVQIARRRRACDAGDGTEIFVDGPEVMIRHVLLNRPGHYLEEISPERRRNAARVKNPWWTGRMEVIQIRAGSHDQKKV